MVTNCKLCVLTFPGPMVVLVTIVTHEVKRRQTKSSSWSVRCAVKLSLRLVTWRDTKESTKVVNPLRVVCAARLLPTRLTWIDT